MKISGDNLHPRLLATTKMMIEFQPQDFDASMTYNISNGKHVRA